MHFRVKYRDSGAGSTTRGRRIRSRSGGGSPVHRGHPYATTDDQLATHRGCSSRLKIQSIAFLGEGWTSQSYLVDGSLVFRFPKRAEVWRELEREVVFLAAAADTLSLKAGNRGIRARRWHCRPWTKAAVVARSRGPIRLEVSPASVLERRPSPRRSPPPSQRPAERRPRGWPCR